MPGHVELPTAEELSVQETQVGECAVEQKLNLDVKSCQVPLYCVCTCPSLEKRRQKRKKIWTNECQPRLNVSSAVLKAAAHHLGSQCDKPNKEFMLCRWEEKDPRKCLEEGRKVNGCALDFFRKIKTYCAEPFTEYWTCIDYSNLLELRRCRKQQAAFDNCVLDKLGWVRPELGDLSKVTKVKTDRPLPDNIYHSRPRPEPNPSIEAELTPSKHGSKMFFWTW